MNEDRNQSGPSSKRRKSNNEEPVAVAVANNETLPSIFKLDVDCFEEVFEYLSLKDLSSVGKTCTRMQKIAGYFYQQNYGAARASYNTDDIFVNNVEVNCFIDFIQKMNIDIWDLTNEADDEESEKQQKLLKSCKSIKEITIGQLKLPTGYFESSEEFLGNVECVIIDYFDYGGDRFDDMLSLCLNLKSLSIVRGYFSFESDECQWLNRHYPKLEYVEFMEGADEEEVPALKNFFELNTSIKRLAIHEDLL